MKDEKASEAVARLAGEFPASLEELDIIFSVPIIALDEAAGKLLLQALAPNAFSSLEPKFQSMLLDTLTRASSEREKVSASRLRCSCRGPNSENDPLIEAILLLMEDICNVPNHVKGKDQARHGSEGGDESVYASFDQRRLILQKLGNLLGLLCSPGVTVPYIRGMLRRLRKPSDITTPLLTALLIAAEKNTSGGGVSLSHYFMFTGKSSCLRVSHTRWPTSSEYAVATWLQIGRYPDAGHTVFLLSMCSTNGDGVQVSLEGGDSCGLWVTIISGSAKEGEGGTGRKVHRAMLAPYSALPCGVWHAIVVKHSKPSPMDFFGRPEIIATVNGNVTCSESLPFPPKPSAPLTRCVIGQGLEGEIGALFLFDKHSEEASALLSSIAAQSSQTGSNSTNSLNNTSNLRSLNPASHRTSSSGGAMAKLVRKIVGTGAASSVAAYLPNRCKGSVCWDALSGWHGELEGGARVWGGSEGGYPVKDVLAAAGGSVLLLPLIERLYVEDNKDSPPPQLSLLLSTIAAYLKGHTLNQRTIADVGCSEDVVELLLSCAPRSRLSQEGIPAAESLMSLISAATLNTSESDTLTGVTPASAMVAGLPLLCTVVQWPRASPTFSAACAEILSATVTSLMMSLEEEESHEHSVAERSAERSAVIAVLPTRRLIYLLRVVVAMGCAHDIVTPVMRTLAVIMREEGDAAPLLEFVVTCPQRSAAAAVLRIMCGVISSPTPPPSRLLRSLELVSETALKSVPGGATSSDHKSAFMELLLHLCLEEEGDDEELLAASLRFTTAFALAAAANPSSVWGESGSHACTSEALLSAFVSKLTGPLDARAHRLGSAAYLAILDMVKRGCTSSTNTDKNALEVGNVTSTPIFTPALSLLIRLLPWAGPSAQRKARRDLGALLQPKPGSDSVRHPRHRCAQTAQSTENVMSSMPWGGLHRCLFLLASPIFAGSEESNCEDNMIDDDDGASSDVSRDEETESIRYTQTYMYAQQQPVSSTTASTAGSVHTHTRTSSSSSMNIDMRAGRKLSIDDTASVSSTGGSSVYNQDMKGRVADPYYAVLKAHSMLLEQAVMWKNEGFEELEMAVALQRLVPNGKEAAQGLLALVASRLRSSLKGSAVDYAESNDKSTSKSKTSNINSGSTVPYPPWENLASLSSLAAALLLETTNVPASNSAIPVLIDTLDRSTSSDTPLGGSLKNSPVPGTFSAVKNGAGTVVLAGRLLQLFDPILAAAESGSRYADDALLHPRGTADNTSILQILLRVSLMLLDNMSLNVGESGVGAALAAAAVENSARLARIVRCTLRSSPLTPGGAEINAMDVITSTTEPATVNPRLPLMWVAAVLTRASRVRKGLESSSGTAENSSETTESSDSAAVLAARVEVSRQLQSIEDLIYAAIPSLATQKHKTNESILHVQSTEISEKIHVENSCDILVLAQAAYSAEQASVNLVRDRVDRRWLQHVSAVKEDQEKGNEDGEGKLKVGTAIADALRQQEARARAAYLLKEERRHTATKRRWCVRKRRLGESWSPWAIDNQEHRKRKLSRHKDGLMRQMVLMPDSHPRDYSGAAYEASVGYASNGSKVSGGGKLTQVFNVSEGHMTEGAEEDEEQWEGSIDDTASTHPATEPDSENRANEVREALAMAVASEGLEGFIDDENMNISSNSMHVEAEEEFGSEPLKGSWSATMVVPQKLIEGTVFLTTKSIIFCSTMPPRSLSPATTPSPLMGDTSSANDVSHRHVWRWRLRLLSQLHLRRFLLSPRAVEMFWGGGDHEVFLAFDDVPCRQAFTRALRKSSTPLFTWPPSSMHPRQVLNGQKLTERWRQRQISNFEYIMQLNVIGGRSYNDITQYPVFPWVLQDYTSETLNLEDPAVYRDLSKPIGALNPQRLEAFLDRYHSFDDPVVPKFMYGSHYSTAGTVLHFLLRQEPFAGLHVDLQGGRFDCPDRLFFDIAQSWTSSLTSMTDVKELIPEFYCCPEIFLNSNNLPLGTLQDQRGTVGDVVLPPWAKDAHDFVRLQRAALESEHVSRHLHLWIELIFGHLQRPPQAVQANNVFYYLTYQGAIDVASITDPLQREAAKAQIFHFGQTPSQLFNEPHPARRKFEGGAAPAPVLRTPEQLLLFAPPMQAGSGGVRGSVLSVIFQQDRCLVIHSDLSITFYSWSPLPDGDLPFTLTLDKTRALPSKPLSMVTCTSHATPGKDSKLAPSSEELSAEPSRVPRTIKSGQSSPSGTRAHKTLSDSSKVHDLLQNLAGLSLNSKSPSSHKTPDRSVNSHIDIEQVNIDVPEDHAYVHTHACVGHWCFALCPGDATSAPTAGGGGGSTGNSSTVGASVAIQGPSTSDLLVSCGYWDDAVKAHSLESGLRQVSSTSSSHLGRVTCVTASADGHVITGGEDCTIRVYAVSGTSTTASVIAQDNSDTDTNISMNASTSLSTSTHSMHRGSSHHRISSGGTGTGAGGGELRSIRVLFGHEASVTCVAMSSVLGICVSGGADGRVAVHRVAKGRLVRTFLVPCAQRSEREGNGLHAVSQIALSAHGDVAVHCSASLCLCTFSLNGTLLAHISTTSPLLCLAITADGTNIATGGEDGALTMRRLSDLSLLKRLPGGSGANIGTAAITALALAPADEYLVIGRATGEVEVCTDVRTRLSMLCAELEEAYHF